MEPQKWFLIYWWNGLIKEWVLETWILDEHHVQQFRRMAGRYGKPTAVVKKVV